MVVAIFSESFRPIVNGVSISIDTFASHLSALGCKIFFFAPRYPSYIDEDSSVFRFPSFRFPHHPDYPLPIPFSRQIFSTFPTLKVDVVHPQTPFLLGWVARYLARKNNCVLVTTYHTIYEEFAHYGYPFPPHLVKIFLRRLSRIFCNLCDAVVVPSSPIKQLLRDYGVYRPIEVIPTGIDLERWFREEDPSVREKLGIPPRSPILIYVGRLAKEKNIPVVLFAFKKLLAKIPNAYLLIIGVGPEEKHLISLAHELNIEGRCHFLGLLPRQEVRNYLASAHLFVSASTTETQGMVLTESLAMGVPVIAADAYGTKEVVRDGVDGFLLPPDVDLFSQKIYEVLTNRALWERLREGALQGAERFSARESAKKLLALYQRLLEERDRKN